MRGDLHQVFIKARHSTRFLIKWMQEKPSVISLLKHFALKMYHDFFCQNNKTLEFNWQKTWCKYTYFQQTTDKTLYPNAADKLLSHMILKHFSCLIFMYQLHHQRLRYLAVSSTDKNLINTVDKKKIEKDFKKYITSKHFKL